MNPISNTAYLTCGARAADAATAKPVCGDVYANLFLDEHGMRVFDAVRTDMRLCSGIVARHRIIDDLLREKIAENMNVSVIVIGAGFDSRAYRLKGGHWIEIDEPQVIECKNLLLPVDQCRNSLQRISIDFAQESLADKLPVAAACETVIVVMEGVCVYLSEAQIRETVRILKHAFPNHTLICELYSRPFMQRYGKKLTDVIEALGEKFRFLADDPSLIFRKLGYKLGPVFSITEKALEFSNEKIAHFIVKHFMPTVAQGSSVYVFKAPPSIANDVRSTPSP